DVNNIPNTYNQTESRFGIRGTDLGNSFKHNNKTYFLFGDTLRVNQAKEQENLDSIAFTVSMCAKNGLTLEFGKQPPLISGGENITQDGFNVPLDGFSLDDNMYVFFSSNHYEIPFGYDQMGRSLLAICTDEEQYTFRYIADFSKDKFSNVSIIQDMPAEEYGLTRSEPGLFIWGSGRYRSSDVYLAFLPYSEIKRHTQGFHRNLSAIFFSGLDANNKPMWSPWEENAVALFKSGCIGELSVRYNWFIKRFIITYNSVNPRGILLRMSQKPWGNWSDHFMLFDGWNIDDAAFLGHKGFGRFIHMGDNKEHKQDHLQDDLIPFQDRSNSFGGEYGPYQVASYTTGIENVFTKLYFTMSTWNPYQVMLMYAIIPAEGNELTKTAEEYAAFDPNCNLGCSPFKRFRSRAKRTGI
ncbi:MAG: DUF4185 domain-containing protein, partial [Ginsengibacter sp.]